MASLNHTLFIIGSVAYAVVAGYLLMWSTQQGRWYLAMLAVWLMAPIPLLGVSIWLEKRSLAQLLDPQTNSWLLYGNVILLPLVAALCALTWRRLEAADKKPYTTLESYGVGVIIGAVVAMFLTEQGAQELPGFRHGAALSTPGSVVHIVVTAPVVVGSLVYCGLAPLVIMALRRELRWQRVGWPLVVFVCYVVLVIVDTWLRPAHDEVGFGGFDWTTFQPTGG